MSANRKGRRSTSQQGRKKGLRVAIGAMRKTKRIQPGMKSIAKAGIRKLLRR